jgi:hypothetical protein
MEGILHVSISYFLHFVDLLKVTYSSTDHATHGEKDSPGCNSEGQTDDVHVVVETSADDVLEGHEVLTEELAVETSEHTVGWISEGTDGG